MSDASMGKKKHRSPAYPARSLKAALDQAKLLLPFAGKHAAPIEGVAEAWGYAASSSGVLQYISALKQFGLLTDEGSKEDRKVKLTPLALDLLHGEEGTPEYRHFLRAAAAKPKLYAELLAKFEGQLPPNDATIRHFLLREKEFNPAAVSEAIRDFRDTMALAGIGGGDTIRDGDEDDEESSESSSSSSSNRGVAGMPLQQTMRIPITLPSLKVAWLEVPYPLNVAEFATLTNSLTTFKDALTKAPEPSNAVNLPDRSPDK